MTRSTVRSMTAEASLPLFFRGEDGGGVRVGGDITTPTSRLAEASDVARVGHPSGAEEGTGEEALDAGVTFGATATSAFRAGMRPVRDVMPE